MKARGDHRFWIFNLKGSGSGSASGDMYIETRQGNFWLDVENVALNLGPAYLNENAEIYSGGTVSGDLKFCAAQPPGKQGRRMLPYGYLDAQLDLMWTALILSRSLPPAWGISISLEWGSGWPCRHTRWSCAGRHPTQGDRGQSRGGNPGHRYRRPGTVLIHTPTDADKPMQLDVRYDALTAFRAGEDTPFLEGNMLKLNYSGSGFIIPDPDLSFKDLWNDERARQRRAGNTPIFGGQCNAAGYGHL